jgi:hypothetical protein
VAGLARHVHRPLLLPRILLPHCLWFP